MRRTVLPPYQKQHLGRPHPSYRNMAIEQQFQIGKLSRPTQGAGSWSLAVPAYGWFLSESWYLTSRQSPGFPVKLGYSGKLPAAFLKGKPPGVSTFRRGWIHPNLRNARVFWSHRSDALWSTKIWALAPVMAVPMPLHLPGKEKTQGLKPSSDPTIAARLKPCPDTKHERHDLELGSHAHSLAPALFSLPSRPVSPALTAF